MTFGIKSISEESYRYFHSLGAEDTQEQEDEASIAEY